LPSTTAFTIAANATQGLTTDTFRGVAFAFDQSNYFGMFSIRGTGHWVVLIPTPDNLFSAVQDTPGQVNVYWSTTNSRYEVQNKLTAPETLTFFMLEY
jgi:hypothetical protein